MEGEGGGEAQTVGEGVEDGGIVLCCGGGGLVSAGDLGKRWDGGCKSGSIVAGRD